MFQSNNPVLTSDTFQSGQTWDDHLAQQDARKKVMTISGAVNASFVLLGLMGASAVASWTLLQSNPATFFPAFIGASILGLILTLVAVFKPKTAPYVSPVVALSEGVFVAAASMLYAGMASGAQSGVLSQTGQNIIFQAGILTVSIALGLLIAYTTRLIKPSRWLINGIIAATFGVVIFMLAAIVISFFSPGFVGSIFSGPLGIGISAVIVVIAAANLIVDFHAIEQGAAQQQPKYMEWLAALGLLITLVWLYVSLLRLLALINRE